MADDRLTIDAGVNSDGIESGMDNVTNRVKQGMNAIGNFASEGMENFKDSIVSAVSDSTIAIAGLGTGAFASVKGMEDIVQGVYATSVNASWEKVSNTIAEVHKQTGLVGDDLQSASKNAVTLSDTFKMDVGESTRAVSSLMKNFRISTSNLF